MGSSKAQQPIAIFLHVATIGRYNEVSDEVLHAIRNSPLFGVLNRIVVNVIGEGAFQLPFRDARISVIHRERTVSAFEHPTLQAIRDFCLTSPDAAVLYLNCLGGRHTGRAYRVRAEWRKLLYYLLIERYASCLKTLENADVCGVDWSLLPLPHMTSNNWWANATYIASLPTLQECVQNVDSTDLSRFGPSWLDREAKRRHAAEFWLGMGARPRAVSLFPLERLGLPTSEYDSVPWWGLPGIRWERVARNSFGERVAPHEDLVFFVQRSFFNLRFSLKPLKRAVVGPLNAFPAGRRAAEARRR